VTFTNLLVNPLFVPNPAEELNVHKAADAIALASVIATRWLSHGSSVPKQPRCPDRFRQRPTAPSPC